MKTSADCFPDDKQTKQSEELTVPLRLKITCDLVKLKWIRTSSINKSVCGKRRCKLLVPAILFTSAETYLTTCLQRQGELDQDGGKT